MSNFVSETELEQIRKRRQEEWEKIRRPDQPLEAPEEEYDPRSLYERLQANKMKAQEEFEESRRLKNLIRGLDDEEVSFLETVDKMKMDEETQRLKEDRDALAEYKRAINNLTEEEQLRKIEEFKKSLYSNSVKTAVKKSSNPLAGLIRPKTAEKPEDKKETPTSSTKTGLVAYGSDSDSSDDESERENIRKKPRVENNS